MDIQNRPSFDNVALAVELIIFNFSIKREHLLYLLVGYPGTLFDILVEEIAHASLYLFHQMKFIVDAINTLFAPPIHLT